MGDIFIHLVSLMGRPVGRAPRFRAL